MLNFLKFTAWYLTVQMIVSYNCTVFYRFANLIEKAFGTLNNPRISYCLGSEKFVDFVCLLNSKLLNK